MLISYVESLKKLNQGEFLYVVSFSKVITEGLE